MRRNATQCNAMQRDATQCNAVQRVCNTCNAMHRIDIYGLAVLPSKALQCLPTHGPRPDPRLSDSILIAMARLASLRSHRAGGRGTYQWNWNSENRSVAEGISTATSALRDSSRLHRRGSAGKETGSDCDALAVDLLSEAWTRPFKVIPVPIGNVEQRL